MVGAMGWRSGDLGGREGWGWVGWVGRGGGGCWLCRGQLRGILQGSLEEATSHTCRGLEQTKLSEGPEFDFLEPSPS